MRGVRRGSHPRGEEFRGRVDSQESGRSISGLTRQEEGFVATDDVDTNIERVIVRARRGGHSAPPSKIRETYATSLSNLVAALRTFDTVIAYDNSRPAAGPRPVLRMRRGKVVFVADDAPAWIASALQQLNARPVSARRPASY